MSSDLEHALEPRFEGAQANQWNDPRDKPRRVGGDVLDVGQGIRKFGRSFADHRDRNVAETRLLRQHGQECFHHPRREAVTDDDAVNVAHVKMRAAASTLSAPATFTRSPMATLSVG